MSDKEEAQKRYAALMDEKLLRDQEWVALVKAVGVSGAFQCVPNFDWSRQLVRSRLEPLGPPEGVRLVFFFDN